MLLHVRHILRLSPTTDVSRVLCFVALALCCLVAGLIIGMTISPVSAQSNSAATQSGAPWGTNYSDTWMVGNNQPTNNADGTVSFTSNGTTPSVTVCGYGMYQEPYNSYGHQSTLNITMTSPNGRTNSYRAYGGSYARGDVSISLLETDLGDYITTHSTTIYCPMARSTIGSGGGSSRRHIGISYSAYYKAAQVDPQRAVYQLVTPCDVTCVFYPTGSFQRLEAFNTPLPQYVRIGEPFTQFAGYKICESIIRAYEESEQPLNCYEIGL